MDVSSFPGVFAPEIFRHFRLFPAISDYTRKGVDGAVPLLPLSNFAVDFVAHFVAAKSTANHMAKRPANAPANRQQRGLHHAHPAKAVLPPGTANFELEKR